MTSVITVLRFGEVPSAKIRFIDGREQAVAIADLARYVSEEENHENVIGVSAAEVLTPGAILEDGLCLVDTPGLGSVFAGNTDVTRRFVPHVDAALFVLGTDPPISGDELELVERLARQVEHLVFVVNKADRFSTQETAQAQEFAMRVIRERLGRDVPYLFVVSAREAAAGMIGRDWPRLVDTLRQMVEQSGASLLQGAEKRGIARIASLLESALEEERLSLERPLDESRARIDALDGTIRDALVSLADLGPLLDAEERRLFDAFERLRERFIAAAVPAARDQCRDAMRSFAGSPRERGNSFAQEIASRWIGEWRREIEPEAESLYRAALMRFTEIGGAFADRLASTDAALSRALAETLDAPGLRGRPRFSHTDLLALTGVGPLRWLTDRLRSHASLHRAATEAALSYVQRLIESNSHRLANDLRERVVESRRLFESDLRRRLHDASESAARAFERARSQHLLGEPAVRHSLTVIGERLACVRQFQT